MNNLFFKYVKNSKKNSTSVKSIKSLDEKNYYEFSLFYKEKDFFQYRSYLNIKTKDEILNNEGDIDYNPPSLLISDKLFNGKKTTFGLH